MPTLAEQQAPIDAAVVNAMIESTPEDWKEIVLTLRRSQSSEGIGGFSHELSSPEGYPPVGPAASLFDATYRLDSLLQSHGGIISMAIYSAKAVGESWSYSVKFEYEENAL